MIISNELIPILKNITQSKDISIEFWNDLEGEELNEMFFSLASELTKQGTGIA